MMIAKSRYKVKYITAHEKMQQNLRAKILSFNKIFKNACIFQNICYNHLGEYQALITLRRLHTMAFKISDECIKCGACAAECPVSAITEGDDKYVIDPDTCISCGNCNSVCPVGAPNEE